jgi:predicted nucleic acid-binding Zn ribbon protein
MDTLITNQSELRHRGFQALTEALGWVNAVRFLRQYDPGSGNYTEERRTLLPDWDASTLVREAQKLQEPREPGT